MDIRCFSVLYIYMCNGYSVFYLCYTYICVMDIRCFSVLYMCVRVGTDICFCVLIVFLCMLIPELSDLLLKNKSKTLYCVNTITM